ncbi:hypothetical protein ScPMuIL_010200 [Solemya velum]
MAEDGSGLDILISHRKLRPAFARMISWEFSRDSEIKPRRRRHSSKKKLSATNMQDEKSEECFTNSDSENEQKVSNQSMDKLSGESGDSDDSEYYSAEEYIGQSKTQIGTSDQSNLLNYSSEIPCVGDGCSITPQAIDIGDVEAKVHPESYFKNPHSERDPHRAPSKKQKRRRRRLKMFFVDKVLPFTDAESFDLDTIQPDLEENFSSSRLFPTLVELCLHKVWGPKSRKQPLRQLPPGMQTFVHHYHRDKSYFRLQLSYLHTELARFIYVENGYSNFLWLKTVEDKSEPVLLTPTRNIWNCVLFTKYAKNNQPHYQKSKASSFLLHSSSSLRVHCSCYEAYQQCHKVVSAVASTIDLMMPSVLQSSSQRSRHRSEEQTSAVRGPRAHHFSGEEDPISPASRSVINRIRAALNARFPIVVEYCFEKALPYVFWARGNLAAARLLFFELAQNEKRVRLKAFYQSEIARMYAVVGERDLAIKFHRMAADTALQFKEASSALYKSTQADINAQMLMLIANVYDQGVMTVDSAKMSASFWNSLFSTSHLPKTCTHRAAIAAVESFLCFHSGGWTGQETTWLEAVKSKLLSLVGDEKALFFHLSLVCALLGEEKEAGKHYTYFCRQLFMYNNCVIVKDFSERAKIIRSNPWMLLGDLMKRQVPVRPLVVVWRVQPSPLSLPAKQETYQQLEIERERFAGDESTSSPLRMAANGYLTGDMQLLLPPIRGVYLDPYTGSLALTHIPGYTEPWKSLETDGHAVPIMMEAYSDSDGRTVQFYSHTCHQTSENSTLGLSFLYWKGPSGETAKLNLIRLIRLEHKKFSEECLKRDFTSRVKEEKNLIEGIRREIERAFRSGHSTDYEFLKRIVIHNQKVDYEWESTKKENKTKTKKAAYKKNDKTLDDFKLHSHCSFGRSLSLHLTCLCLKKSFYVFVDCQSKESFLQPKIIIQEISKSSGKLKVWNGGGTSNTQIGLALGPVLHVQWKKLKMAPAVLIYNDERQLCDAVGYEDLWMEETCRLPRVIGRRLFHLEDKSLVCRMPRPFEKTDTVDTDVEDEDIEFVSTVDVVRFVGDSDEKYETLITDVSVKMTKFDPQVAFRVRQNTQLLPGLQTVVKTEVAVDKLVVMTTEGVAFLDPDSLQIMALTAASHMKPSLPMTPDGKWFKGKFSAVNVLGNKTLRFHNQTVQRVAVAIDNHLVILDIPSESGSEEPSLDIVLCVALPGDPKEICFILPSVGFLVSTTLQTDTTKFYRENVLHLDFQGHLLGILPLLGPGPRRFCATYLTGNSEWAEKKTTLGGPGWYVYMRDGHSGILGLLPFLLTWLDGACTIFCGVAWVVCYSSAQ